MEMFNTHRRDILNFDNYMDLKKPGFGGPASAQPLRDARGKKVNQNPKLKDYQRIVKREAAFSHPVWDPTYKAMTHDLVYKQEGMKPFKYRDPYLTAVPVVNYEFANEGKSFESFAQFINEADSNEPTIIKLRGREDADALSMAEDELDALKIDWDELAKGGTEFLKDGDLVAYVNLRTRELVIMPDAEKMSDEAYQKMMGVETEKEAPGFEEFDEYESEEDSMKPEYQEEEMIKKSEYERMPTSSDLGEIEKLLKSFETGPEEDEDEF